MNTKVLFLVILMLFVGVAEVLADPVAMELPYQTNTTLAYPKSYSMMFSLWTAETVGEGTEVWSEEKPIALKSSKISTILGDVTPLDAGIFSQQLWVQVERKRHGDWVVLGTRDKLRASPYALGSVPNTAVPGQVLTGQIAVIHPANASFFLVGGSYPVPLPPGTPAPTLEYLTTTSATCPGIGQSTPGQLCVYGYNTDNVYSVETSGGFGNSNRLYGFSLDVFPASEGSEGYLLASWAYMVPSVTDGIGEDTQVIDRPSSLLNRGSSRALGHPEKP
jgi:hypothetical protein